MLSPYAAGRLVGMNDLDFLQQLKVSQHLIVLQELGLNPAVRRMWSMTLSLRACSSRSRFSLSSSWIVTNGTRAPNDRPYFFR